MSTAMRVLQVIDGLPPEQWGGAEQFCLALTAWLTAHEAHVDIAAPARAQRNGTTGALSLHRVQSKYLRKAYFDLFSPGNARRLSAIISSVEPDVVHFHNLLGISSQLVGVAARLRPAVVTLHGYGFVELFNPIVDRDGLRFPRQRAALLPWQWFSRSVHRRHLANATLVSPSRYLARYYESQGFGTVRVIPNGVSLPDETTAGEARMLFVGRLSREKGLQRVLGPMEHVASDLGWQIDVVGDGPLRSSLQSAFPSVRFHGRADPAPHYQRAGIVVMPSLWPENFPYVALEAMSYGATVLATDVGGIPEIVEDNVTGRLFDPNDIEQFTALLRELVLDPGMRERLGRTGRERIAREFSWDTVGPRYLALYEELTARRASPRVAVE
jgi:glycosyltransferase involved in cell wall biosynthesis